MEIMNIAANKLLTETIPKWIHRELTPQIQDETKATNVSMIKKEDAQINLEDDPYLNFRKIMAYEEWPRAYFVENDKRVIINSATWNGTEIEILRVTPEGKKEMDYSIYRKNQKLV